MNLLAHAYLGRDLSDESNTFNVLWDFVRRQYLLDTRAVVLGGRKRHIAIDKAADQQDWFRFSRSLISEARRKASPVLIDIFCDYFLIHHWEKVHAGTVEEFIDDLSDMLRRGAAQEGGALLDMAELVTSQRWFDDYRTVDGIGRVLGRVARRSSPRLSGLLLGAEEELALHQELMGEGFPSFFGELDRSLRPQ